MQDAASLLYSYREECFAVQAPLWDVLYTGRSSEFGREVPPSTDLDRLKNSLYKVRAP